MEGAFITCSVILLAIQIWLITLFVLTYGNIKKIHFQLKDMINPDVSVSKKDVKLAIITGSQDKIYKQIVVNLFNFLYDKVATMQKSDLNTDSFPEIEDRIKITQKYCDVLGKKLPMQLSSLKAFVDFYNGN